ncbi:MAG TPA: haloacid dehalogenase type II [Ktedonobacterales bacterium]|jgi:2-haloacid dehalogenase|nr:haloacid dehalogenase type II [Ktedonobacterales bacterium]
MAVEELGGVRALAFDVFGTVVDYRSTIIAEGAELNRAKGIAVDWAAFADDWRAQYRPNMRRVARGELPWMNLDALHRRALDELLARYGVTTLSAEETQRLNRVWHRLRPWPDALAGLTRLRARYILTTLSNGNVALLVEMARRAGLPWDCIFSAELVQAYKPDPRAYQMVYHLLDMQPDEVMLVAAHPDDLRAARAQGLRTCFVPRPLEGGPHATLPTIAEPEVDLVAADFVELARLLGA